MADLILLNGPPASGKSTVANELVARRPLALNLDIDLVRQRLGRWTEQPLDAGLATRRLALAMATTHLAAGHDVIVPQFLARQDFIVELASAAGDVGVRFVEVALIINRDEAIEAFARRSAEPINRQQREASEMVEHRGGTDALSEMYDNFVRLIDARPTVRRVEVVRGDIQETVRRVERVIASVVER